MLWELLRKLSAVSYQVLDVNFNHIVKNHHIGSGFIYYVLISFYSVFHLNPPPAPSEGSGAKTNSYQLILLADFIRGCFKI